MASYGDKNSVVQFLKFFTSRKFWQDFLVGFLFGCVVLAILWLLKPWQSSIPLDFLIHYQASERLLGGYSPYVSWNLPALYNYPPIIFPFIFWLSFFKKSQVFLIWQIFSILSLIISAFLITKIIQEREKKEIHPKKSNLVVLQGWTLLKKENSRSFLLFLAFLSFFPTRFGFFMGQVNNFVLLSLCLFFYNFFKISPNPPDRTSGWHPSLQKRGIFVDSDFWTGWWLVIATFLKLTPVIFVPYLVLKGRKRALVSFFSVAILIFLISSLAFGFNQYILWWQNLRPALFAISGKAAYYNQAVSGLISRGVGENKLGFMLTPFLEAVLLVTAFGLIWIVEFLKKQAETKRELLEISLILTTMLLVNRFTWQHHLVWILPVFILSGKYFVDGRKWRPRLFLLGFCFLLINHNFPRFEEFKAEPLSWTYLSHATWGLLVLWGMLGWGLTNCIISSPTKCGVERSNKA